jgi:hypothetical protein
MFRTLDQNVNTGRTSTNAWCQNACQEDPVTKAVEARIEEILGIPQANFEYLQMLRYEMSQFYQVVCESIVLLQLLILNDNSLYRCSQFY